MKDASPFQNFVVPLLILNHNKISFKRDFLNFHAMEEVPILLDKLAPSELLAPSCVKWCDILDLCALALGESVSIMRLKTKDLTWQRICSIAPPDKHVISMCWSPNGNSV